jgi:hypothetical protein
MSISLETLFSKNFYEYASDPTSQQFEWLFRKAVDDRYNGLFVFLCHSLLGYGNFLKFRDDSSSYVADERLKKIIDSGHICSKDRLNWAKEILIDVKNSPVSSLDTLDQLIKVLEEGQPFYQTINSDYPEGSLSMDEIASVAHQNRRQGLCAGDLDVSGRYELFLPYTVKASHRVSMSLPLEVTINLGDYPNSKNYFSLESVARGILLMHRNDWLQGEV